MNDGTCEQCGRELVDGECPEHWAPDRYGEPSSIELQAREQAEEDHFAEIDAERESSSHDAAIARARFARKQAGLDPDPPFLHEERALEIHEDAQHEHTVGGIVPLMLRHEEWRREFMVDSLSKLSVGSLNVEIEYLDSDPDEWTRVTLVFGDARVVLEPRPSESQDTWHVAGDVTHDVPDDGTSRDVDLGF